jgi:hypothetical protein
MELSVFLLDEEEGCSVGAFGWANVTFLHVLLDEFFQLLLFELSEGIDFSGYGTRGVGFEFNGMVPDSWFWKALSRLFAKDFVMTLVADRYWTLGGILSRGTEPFDSRYENWVLLSSSWRSGSGEEFGSGCIRTSYDDGELGVVEPSSEPVDLRLDGREPWVPQDQFVVP